MCIGPQSAGIPQPIRSDAACDPGRADTWEVSDGSGGTTTCWTTPYWCDCRTDYQKWRDEAWYVPGRPYAWLTKIGPLYQTGCGSDHDPDQGPDKEGPGRHEWRQGRGGGKHAFNEPTQNPETVETEAGSA